MTPWQEYKKKMGTARPWQLLDPSNYVDENLEKERYDICLSCPELIALTKQCKQCGCVMSLKTKLRNAVCPLDKW
jgi:hypothetical protein